MSVMPRLASAAFVIPRCMTEAGPGNSVTMIEDCASTFSKPANWRAGENPLGGSRETREPATRRCCAQSTPPMLIKRTAVMSGPKHPGRLVCNPSQARTLRVDFTDTTALPVSDVTV
jgi:hypothetical protein